MSLADPIGRFTNYKIFRLRDDFGACRPVRGGREGRWSEHARAHAIDIAGVRLKDGRRIGVASDWKGEGREAAFLREVRDGACGSFSTVLSPDYNRAHRDHLHLDQAGRAGRSFCRYFADISYMLSITSQALIRISRKT